MLSVPPGVTFSYNGYSFNAGVKTQVHEDPIESGDQRVKKYSKLTITVSGWITQNDADGLAGAVPGMTIDAFMQMLRRKLQVNGKTLIYKNKGYGQDLNINSASAGIGIRDVAMGPKAGKLTWRTLGGMPDGSHAAIFEWSVSTCIVECQNFPLNPGPDVFSEISFGISYDTDEAGIVTITYSGTAQIPLSLRANNTLERNIDDVFPSIIRPVPDGFLRRINRRLSTDRAYCYFTIIDRQVEVPFEPDVVNMDMRERFRQVKVFAPIWEGSISGTIRLSPTAEKGLAWRRFFNIAAQRMRAAANLARLYGSAADLPVLPGPISLEEDLFKNESRFSIDFKYIGGRFDFIIRASGLWRPFLTNNAQIAHIVPAVNEPWTAQQWTASLSNNAQATRGILGAHFRNEDDIIIDVCATPTTTKKIASPPAIDRTVNQVVASAQGGDVDDLEDVELSELLGDDDPEDLYPAVNSWLAWECIPIRHVGHNQFRHKPLNGTVKMNAPKVDPFGSAKTLAEDTTEPAGDWTASVPDVIQQTASPSLTLTLRGHGIRVAHRVNAPKLLSYGNQTPILQDETVVERVIGAINGVKIYRTDWQFVYLLKGNTATVPLLADPLLDVDGTAAQSGTSNLGLLQGVQG